MFNIFNIRIIQHKPFTMVEFVFEPLMQFIFKRSHVISADNAGLSYRNGGCDIHITKPANWIGAYADLVEDTPLKEVYETGYVPRALSVAARRMCFTRPHNIVRPLTLLTPWVQPTLGTLWAVTGRKVFSRPGECVTAFKTAFLGYTGHVGTPIKYRPCLRLCNQRGGFAMLNYSMAVR